MAHSYSSLSKYNSCPQSFYRQYVLKEVKFEPSESAAYGSEMHDHIDKAFKGEVEFTPRYEFLRPIVDGLKSFNGEVKTEYEMSFKHDRTETGWWDKTSFIKGKADCVLFHPEQPRVMLKDWKFAKVNPSSYALEMDMFSMLLFWKHPEIERVDTGLVWLKIPAPETKNTYTRDKLPEVEDTILSNIERVETSIKTEEFPMKVSGLCFGYCSCTLCPRWKPLKKKH